MNSFFMLVGILAISIFIIIIIKKIYNYLDDRKVGTEISEKIYHAAREFSNGASEDEIRDLLLNCIDLDEDDIEEILELSVLNRADHDGGYGAFIKNAKNILRNY